MTTNDKPREDEQRSTVIRISYVVGEAGKESTEVTVVPSFMAQWMAAELAKRRGVRPMSISMGKELPVRIDQYNAAVQLRERIQSVDLAALRVAMVFARSNDQDTLHPETCLAIMEIVQRGVGELREWVDEPLNYMVGKGVTTAIPFPPPKQ